jgi:2,3-bisphosphoglycerate-dependent phosphoglycerate mutase
MASMENALVLVRHGESEWNKLNLFTGWRDVDLTETGVEEAHRAGRLLKAEGLHERDYGDLAGLNKDDARAKWGEEQVHIWRRSFDVPPPGGESLKDTAERVLPYYNAQIWPQLQAGKTVIVAAHGNSLRALVMQLDGLSREEVLALNLATGVPLVYRLNADGSAAEKRLLAS